MGIEPTAPAWKAGVLPLYDGRACASNLPAPAPNVKAKRAYAARLRLPVRFSRSRVEAAFGDQEGRDGDSWRGVFLEGRHAETHLLLQREGKSTGGRVSQYRGKQEERRGQ